MRGDGSAGAGTATEGRANALLSQHGLAYHLESLRGGERREILLDFSLTDLTLFNNYRALGVDPTRADALVISQGHRDHYGALTQLARTWQGKLQPGLALYAGGEDTFCHRVSVASTGATTDQGQLDRGALEGRGINVVLAKKPTVVAGQAFTSGQIQRTIDFEKPPAAARLTAGPMDSMCSPARFGATKVETKPGELVTDMFWGEHATAYHVKDRGLVIRLEEFGAPGRRCSGFPVAQRVAFPWRHDLHGAGGCGRKYSPTGSANQRAPETERRDRRL